MLNRLCLLNAALLTISACENPRRQWSKDDCANAYQVCMAIKQPNTTFEMQQQVCDCYLEKLQNYCPNPNQQAEMPLTDFEQLLQQCQQQIKIKK